MANVPNGPQGNIIHTYTNWANFYKPARTQAQIAGRQLRITWDNARGFWRFGPAGSQNIIRLHRKGLPWSIWDDYNQRIPDEGTCSLDTLVVACLLMRAFVNYPVYIDGYPGHPMAMINPAQVLANPILPCIPFLLQLAFNRWDPTIGYDWSNVTKCFFLKEKRRMWFAIVAREETRNPPGSRRGINPYRTLEYLLEGAHDNSMRTYPAHYCQNCEEYYDLDPSNRAEWYRLTSHTLLRPEAAWANIGNLHETHIMERLIERWFKQSGMQLPAGAIVPNCPQCNRPPVPELARVHDDQHGNRPEYIAVGVPSGQWWDNASRQLVEEGAAASVLITEPTCQTHPDDDVFLRKTVTEYMWEGAIYEDDGHVRLYWRDQDSPNPNELLMYDSIMPIKRGRGVDRPSNDGPIIGGIPEIRPPGLAAGAPNNVKVHPAWAVNPMIIFYRRRPWNSGGNTPENRVVALTAARAQNLTNALARGAGAGNLVQPAPPPPDANGVVPPNGDYDLIAIVRGPGGRKRKNPSEKEGSVEEDAPKKVKKEGTRKSARIAGKK